MNTQNTSFWSSNLGFMLACIGAAVGLGNIWKFPYMTGTQGGGAFVFIYLITIFAIAIPVAAAELLIGRKGQSDAGTSVVNVATENQRSSRWGAIGGLGVLASFILLTFYAVIAGWVSAYIWRSVSGQIGGLDAAGAGSMFGDLLANPGEMIFHQILFLAFIALILVRQLSAGLERANLILMPSLVVMLVLIAVYGAIAGDMGAALAYLFTPDFSKITPEVVQSAVGQGFFSVGVGAAMLITYGAYLDKSINIGKAAIIIGLGGYRYCTFGRHWRVLDCLRPVAGSGLRPGTYFHNPTSGFSQLTGGSIWAFIFFLLVYFAALTSGLSLGEVVIRWAENRFGWSRHRAMIVTWRRLFLSAY